MKSVYFIRHGKSSWDDISISDHERPLNERGKRDSKNMGRYLVENGHKIDLIISSSAKRAKSTAKNINEMIKSGNVQIEPKLYHSSAMTILRVVQNIPNELESAIIVAHNPGMTDVANIFSDDPIINVPTTGIFKVDFNIENWAEAESHNGTIDFFIYPKLIDND